MISDHVARNWLYVATAGFVPGACPACQARKHTSRKAPKGSNPNPGEVLINETAPSWRLYNRPKGHGRQWHSLVLRRSGNKSNGVRKWAYWLAWNGQRLALGRDAKILLENDPEVLVWVEMTCSSHQWELER